MHRNSKPGDPVYVKPMKDKVLHSVIVTAECIVEDFPLIAKGVYSLDTPVSDPA